MPREALSRMEVASHWNLATVPRSSRRVTTADAVFAITASDGRVPIGSVDRHSKALMVVEIFHVGEIWSSSSARILNDRTWGRLSILGFGGPETSQADLSHHGPSSTPVSADGRDLSTRTLDGVKYFRALADEAWQISRCQRG
jgi:hypothetical protein